MSAPISAVVNVTIGAVPTFPQGQGFGLINIVGSSARLPLGQRARSYSVLTDVAADFQTTDEEYKAAQVFFAQNPRPPTLMISRRYIVAVSGELLGSTNADTNIAHWQAITTGAFTVSIDGAAGTISGLNFSAAANMNAVAADIQTAMQIAHAASTCIWTGKQFKLTSGTTGPTSTITFTTSPGAGVDITAMMATRAADGAIQTAGSAIETIAQSLSNLQLFNSAWYGLAFTTEVTEQNIQDAAAWTEANLKYHGYTSNNFNNTDSTSTTSLSYIFKNDSYSRTFGIYDNIDHYPHVSYLAYLLSVNFTQPDSTITMKFKVLPGNSTITITETQRLALEANNMNYYTYFDASPMVAEGVSASGTFSDQVVGLDWLQNSLETAVFGYLYTRPNKVPQTDKGVASVLQKLDKGFDVAVSNGLIAPGYWEGSAFGTLSTGDYVPKGYYSYAAPVATQSSADRAARKAPPITCACLGAGAIHSLNINVTFQP